MTVAAPVLVEATGLCLRLGGNEVLRDVDIRIGGGEFWCLLGANGAGKTSFLHAVLGLVPLSAGRLQLHPDVDPRHLGFVPQACRWNRSMPTTVREFVDLGTVGLRLTAAQRRQQGREALATVGLSELEWQDLWTLSGGQRQRAMVARALIRRPRLLILDEPTASLDPAAAESLLQLLATLHRESHTTLLFVTHELEVAQRYASHVALFHDGRVVAGPRAEVLRQENLAEIYGPEWSGRLPALGGHCA